MNRIIFNIDRCKGCGLCVEACPKKLLALSKTVINKNGQHPPVISDMSKCIACAMCATMCPDCVIKIEKEVND